MQIVVLKHLFGVYYRYFRNCPGIFWDGGVGGCGQSYPNFYGFFICTRPLTSVRPFDTRVGVSNGLKYSSTSICIFKRMSNLSQMVLNEY